jgi:dimethylargininase
MERQREHRRSRELQLCLEIAISRNVMIVALTREISPAITRCELTHLRREPIDLETARAQHLAYEASLREAGCRVERLAAGEEMPDSVFIEDTAVVFDEVAIITRPGAMSRRLEIEAVARALQTYRPLCSLESPATADGGDVLVVGRDVYVGRSRRTNDAGIDQIRRALLPYGYSVTAVDVRGCLHLKSAVTMIGDGFLLMNPLWLPDRGRMASCEIIEVHPDEPAAANALRVGDRVLCSSAFPRTLERLQQIGIRTAAVDASEVAKAEGALTCCSLIFSVTES